MKKIDGVQSVAVSLNKGLVTIELAAGNRLTMPELRRVITANGFNPKEATVVVNGVLDDRDGTPTLRSSVTNETFVLAPAPTALAGFDDAKRAAVERARVEIAGRIDPAKKPDQLAVTSVTLIR